MGKKSAQKKNRSKSPANRPQNNQGSTGMSVARKEMLIPSLSGGEATAAVPANNQPAKTLNFGEQTEYVRSDILRISLLLIIIALILGSLVIANKKSDWLQHSGKQLSSFMKLQ